jgi:hypothetical protein
MTALPKTLFVSLLLAAVTTSRAIAQAGVTRRPAASTPGALRTITAVPSGRSASAMMVGQVVVGSLAAAGGGIAAWRFYDNAEGADRRVKGDAGYTPNANTAYAVGSFVGAVAGTHLMGRIAGMKGNVFGAVLGAAIPTIPLLFGREEPYLPLIGIVLGAPLQALGGAIGNRLARQ